LRLALAWGTLRRGEVPRKPAMHLDRRLLKETRRVCTPLTLTVGCGWLAGALLVGQALCLSRTIAQVFLADRILSDVQWLLLVMVALGLARSALVWGSQVAAQRVAGAVKSDLRARLSAHLLALGPAYVRDERTGELTTTAIEGIEALDAYFGQYLPQLATAALVPLTIFIFVTPLDFISGLVLLLTAPLIPLFMILIGSQADRLTRRQWASLSRMSAHFLDVLQGLSTLKLLGRSRQQAENIAQVSDRYRRTTMAVLRVTFLSALMLELVATISTAVVAVTVGLRLLYGHLAFEQAFLVLILAPEFYLPLRALGARFHAGVAGSTAARRIYQVLEAPTSPQPPRPLPLSTSWRGEGGWGDELRPFPPIRFADVHYAYADSALPALNGISFETHAVQKTALVGPSGAGKSTIVQLLLRFISPDQGVILVGDTPLHEIAPAAWRAQLAWVPQNPYLFHASVAENIRLGRPDATLEQVTEAARQAHAHSFVETLAEGYDTPIGERGIRLSGGQAQRIALARAFLKDAPLLILDEATSNLDPEHEALVQESITRLARGRTVLIIAHRLSTARDADQILVVADGRIVQAGTHATLMAQAGLYRRLVTAHDK
jgi:ATP-binding cassette subfamily C protein CydD